MCGHSLLRGDDVGYRIVYGPEISAQKRKIGTGFRLRTLIAAALLVFSLLVRLYWPEGCQKLRSAVMPEAVSGTQAAAEILMKDLKDGTPFTEALTSFCMKIIERDETY